MSRAAESRHVPRNFLDAVQAFLRRARDAGCTGKEVMDMNSIRRSVLVPLVAGATLVGGIVGATAFGADAGNAQATTTTTSSPRTPSGTFKPNEDPTHEAGESAAREAQEDAGQLPTVP